MHLDRENFASARVGNRVRWQEQNLFVGLHNPLLNTSSKHITHTLNLVGTRDGETHWGISIPLGYSGEVVQSGKKRCNVMGLTLGVDRIYTLPPGHLLRGLDQVVPHPSRDRDDGHGLLNEVLLPSNLLQHVLHLITDLHKALLLVSSGVRVHLVHSNQQLLHTQQVQQTSVLACLSLYLTSFVVSLLDGCGEVTICGNHQQGDIGLSSSRNHVLDEITMAWGINDGVMPLVCEELLCRACNGHTTLALFLLTIHVESKSERGLAKTLCFLLQLLHVTLGDTTQFEQKASGGGGLAGIDMSADDNRKMLLFSHD
mmetsp:Transcript_6221/g.21876  ORF Transcript_6221/g.21876 Transcript_6221/m.21876 type:complete len:314 (-) Transcript_6221:93-1034(-)